MVRVFLGVGSNDAPEKHYAQGLQLLTGRFGTVETSAVYESISATYQNTLFWNGIFSLETALTPAELKAVLVAIEDQTGRIRRTPDGKKHQRVTLDLDILLYGETALEYEFQGKRYHLPHADLLDYDYVFLPLLDLAPDLRHPETGQALAEMVADLPTPSRKQGG